MSYDIVRRIGRGGMGVVDLATDPEGRFVALKRLALHGTPDEIATARQRIGREAEVLHQLDHPGIVKLLEVVVEYDDLILVMDYLPGGNLAERVATHGPLTPDEVGHLSDQLLDALATAHRQGIVHRDIKPANVLFAADGTAQLADFGVARHRDATVGLTATEMVVGTPGFMAPEQARGEEATAASDVFSLGATLLFAATGTGPFGDVNPQLLMMRAAAGKTERVPKALTPALRKRIGAMMATDPMARPTAAAARGGPAGTDPGRPINDRRRPTRALRIAGVAIIGVGAIALAVAVLGGGSAEQGDSSASAVAPSVAITGPATCIPRPYQPCGEQPAPNTDGGTCLEGFDNYDGDPATGCEAESIPLEPGALLKVERSGNLVPRDAVDEYLLEVRDNFHLDCSGQVQVTLTAPVGVTQRLSVLDGPQLIDSAISGDASPASVSVSEPNCFSDDATTLTVRIEWVGSGRTADPYLVETSGSF